MKKLKEEIIQGIISMYAEGKTLEEIGTFADIDKNSVRRLLRKRGLFQATIKEVSDENIAIIIRDYQSGVSSEIIATNLGINGSTVCRILKRNNIPIRPSEENKRKYKIDDTFFEKIDTEEKAYYLGLLYADGNLSKKGYEISISLHSQDEDILKKFSNAIYGFVKLSSEFREKDSGKITEYKDLAIYSKKMHKELIQLGCPPDKAFDIRFPTDEIVPENLKVHFIRGYLDGDGCISTTREAKTARPVIDFTSNMYFINDLREYVYKSIGINFNDPTKKKNKETLTRSLQLTGQDKIKNFLDYLYKDATIYMNRKKNYYLQYLIILENKKKRSIDKKTDIKNYGTTFIPSHNRNLLDTVYSEGLSITEKNKIAEDLIPFYRENGFPYPLLNDNDLIKDFNNLKNVNIDKVAKNGVINLNNYSGTGIFKHFAPHFYEVKSGIQPNRPSAIELFEDDDLLKRVIFNRLNQNYHLTGNMLKQGMYNSKLAFRASIFLPSVAKYIYQTYTKDGDNIYDYSMGFGQRLLGALSLPHRVNYIGVDPYSKSVKSNQDIFDFFGKNIVNLNKTAEIICEKSENYCDSKYLGQIDLAFSSPPYFFLERYCEENSQAYQNNNYLDFIHNYWAPTAKNISKLLKNNGTFILNIKDVVSGFNLKEDFINIMNQEGFELVDTLQIKLTKNLYFNNKNNIDKFEPIYIMKRK